MNKLTGITFVALMALALLFSGCHKDSVCISDGQEPDAALTVRLNVPAIGAEVKSVSEYPSDPQQWSRWERAVDGRYLFRVTAFLLQGDRLVAVKDLIFDDGDEPAEAEMSFDGNFVHGAYRLMVVANYSAHSAEDGDAGVKTYGGMADLCNTIQEVLGTSGVIENFTGTYADSFLNRMISSQEGVCERVPQPLSLVKDIELHPGTNIIEGELLRTYSRIRIAVENQSDEPLAVSSLAFGDLFTQTSAYLFPNIGFTSGKTNINVAHANAITPFTSDGASPLTIPGKSVATIFDAYILESGNEGETTDYSYSLGLGYGGTGKFTLSSTNAINNASGVSEGYYLIYNVRRGRYLKAGSSKVESSSLGQLQEGDELSEEYVWALDHTGLSGNQYYVGTPEILQTGDQTAYYMGQTSSSGVVLNSMSNSPYYFTFSTYWYNYANYLSMKSSYGGNNSYVQVSSNGTVSGTGSQGNSTRLYLYPVARSGSSVHEIPLRTIDESTGQAAQVEEIRRNDFINVLVAVSYNRNTGHFEFEVKDWESAGGDVSFN